MAAIYQRITYQCSPLALYEALTTQAGLSAWWTDTETNGELNSIAHFRFGTDEQHHVQMKIKELVPNKTVIWQCVSGPWIETGEFIFNIEDSENGAVLKFEHNGWPNVDDFYMHCNAKWGFFFTVSLKQYLESGTGLPHPNDPNI